MMSLFSSFDVLLFNLSSISLLFFLFFLSLKFWFNSFFDYFKGMILLAMSSFFSSLSNFKFKLFDNFILSLMLFLFVINFLSIFPFLFSYTSQFSFNFFWGFSLWSALFLFGLFNNLKHVLIHFIPEGTPLLLIWFLFFVEMISNIIRPLTLVVRLLANILAGHLLMILLSKMVFLISPFIFFYAVLNLVEFLVSLIQSYIFVTMLCLYFSEVN